MKIGIYGGSFNPPHLAHVMAVSYAIAQADLDVVYVVPCWDHAFGKVLAPFEDRFDMCRRAFRAFNPMTSLGTVRIADWEKLFKTKYTVDLLEHLLRENRFKHNDLYLIVGTDNTMGAEQWHRWNDVVDLVQGRLILLPRPGTASADRGGFLFPDISSTAVRAKLASGDVTGLEYMVPKAVLGYIQEYGLYAGGTPE